ncbi:MAG: sugar phosphate isomerase/epimerase [Firmicutes bacterium]|nr:sugar phosphate isomerase/epimerase [Bacillota bacterium]
MKLCIRAHDLGVTGTEAILQRLDALGIDGVQMVCYKAYPDIPQAPGGITPARAAQIGQAFANAGKDISLIGAYFNPIHSNAQKVAGSLEIFEDYLRVGSALGCNVVASETGSRNDDEWTYHPENRTEEALQGVVAAFSRLCDTAADCGSIVAMEGCAGHVCWNVETLSRARKMIGRRTRVVFDLYNFMDAENQGAYLSILDRGLDLFAGDIQVFHMKDCMLSSGRRPIQTPYGRGELDHTEILRRIKSYDPNAVLVLEETTGEHIAYAVQTIRRIWAEI